jgi:GNAT superfamily N-acetyltransferase
MTMTVQIIPGFDRPEQVRELFTEYTRLIIDRDSSFREYLAMQNYEEELFHLEKKYGPPFGRLYLAYCNQVLAGCIALRQLDEHRCEMKRLYVRPQFRKQHIGSILVRRVIAEAKSIGYKHLLLDTFPFLDVAVRMYEKLGFRHISRYNDSPMDSTIYMQLDL